jgi:hypothetical protein
MRTLTPTRRYLSPLRPEHPFWNVKLPFSDLLDIAARTATTMIRLGSVEKGMAKLAEIADQRRLLSAIENGDIFPVHPAEQVQSSSTPEEPQCCCYQYMGDNPDCPIHGKKKVIVDDPDRDNADILRAARKAGFPNAVIVTSEEISRHWEATSESYKKSQPSHNDIYPY